MKQRFNDYIVIKPSLLLAGLEHRQKDLLMGIVAHNSGDGRSLTPWSRCPRVMLPVKSHSHPEVLIRLVAAVKDTDARPSNSLLLLRNTGDRPSVDRLGLQSRTTH